MSPLCENLSLLKQNRAQGVVQQRHRDPSEHSLKHILSRAAHQISTSAQKLNWLRPHSPGCNKILKPKEVCLPQPKI